MKSRYDIAKETFDRVFNSTPSQIGGVRIDTPVAQDFYRLCAEHCYADAWSREEQEGGFDFKMRSLITITCLVAMGITNELKIHLRTALKLGHEPDDLIELFIQILPYAGTPRTIQAMRYLAEILAEEEVQK